MNNLWKTTTTIKNLEIQVVHLAKGLSQQVQNNLLSNTINNPRNHESVNFVTPMAQKEKLPKPNIKLPYPQRLKGE